MIEAIHQCQSLLVGAHVMLRACAVSDYAEALSTAEKQVVASAIAIRRQTYSTGRYCAKQALAALQVSSDEFGEGLLRQDDGSVSWPAGCIGSISHTNHWAVAVAGRNAQPFRSVGVDIEHIDRVNKLVLKQIATDRERASLDEIPELPWARAALFSIKESLYKCLRPVHGAFFGFKDVELLQLNRLAESGELVTTEESTALRVYTPSVSLLLPSLQASCEHQRIAIRFVVVNDLVISFVSYR